jgi:hypothetical protein
VKLNLLLALFCVSKYWARVSSNPVDERATMYHVYEL